MPKKEDRMDAAQATEKCKACDPEIVGSGGTIPTDAEGKCLGCGREIMGPIPAEPIYIDTEFTEIVETLRCPLTDEGYKDYAIAMGQAKQEISRIEDELTAVKSQFKSRLDAANGRLNELAAIINTGAVYQPVTCRRYKNYREGTITVIRPGGEVVRTRPMTTEERQRGLFQPLAGMEDEEEAAAK